MSRFFPNSYNFRNISEFVELRDKLQPTSRYLLATHFVRSMEGLLIVNFNSRISFNVRGREADISDLSGDYPIILERIVGGLNVMHGLNPDERYQLTKMEHATFGKLQRIFKRGLRGLVINAYDLYQPIQLDRFSSDGFGIPDNFDPTE